MERNGMSNTNASHRTDVIPRQTIVINMVLVGAVRRDQTIHIHFALLVSLVIEQAMAGKPLATLAELSAVGTQKPNPVYRTYISQGLAVKTNQLALVGHPCPSVSLLLTETCVNL